ncbi:MAG: ferritin family protein [Desulfobacterales bacterium]|jgi:rubrerythrin|nr:ferritin family protein [Desulfobacterales bacterium]
MDLIEFRKIMEFAIKNEIKAQEFYQSISEKVDDTHLKKMFLGFVEDEKGHQVFLENFLSGDYEEFHLNKSKDIKLSEKVERPEPDTSMKPADAIALAMKEEEDAMNLYIMLAETFTEPKTQKTFLDLAEMERRHKQKMENAYVDIGYPETW